MKILTIIAVFICGIVLFSCDDKVSKSFMEKKVFYSATDEFVRLVLKDKENYKNIIIVDTFCINQAERAYKDIEDNNLTFYLSQFQCEFEGMKKLLKQYNIKVENIEHQGVNFGFSYHCYENIMNDTIYNRFGEKFIDSLMFLAEREFVINHPDSLYMKDGIDVRTKHLK